MKRKSLIILLLIMCFVAVGCGSKSDKTETDTKKEDNAKSVTYFSDSKSTDKLGFTLTYYDGINVFFGINTDGVSENFDKDETYLKNDKIEINSFDDDDISFEFDGEDYYIGFATGYVYYNDDEVVENEETTEEETTEEETTEEETEKTLVPTIKTFDSEDVLYQDGNYIVTKYYSKYYVYYLAIVNERYSSDYGYAIKFDYYYSEDEAKEKVDYFKENFTLCSYEDEISNCKDADGNKVDYKKYRHIKDMIVDYLAANNLYIDSYEKVDYFNYGITKVVDKSTIANGEEISFKIDINAYSYYGEDDIIGKLNGSEIYYRDSVYDIYMKNGDRYTSIELSLPYGVEESAENIMKSLKDTFKK